MEVCGALSWSFWKSIEPFLPTQEAFIMSNSNPSSTPVVTTNMCSQCGLTVVAGEVVLFKRHTHHFTVHGLCGHSSVCVLNG